MLGVCHWTAEQLPGGLSTDDGSMFVQTTKHGCLVTVVD